MITQAETQQLREMTTKLSLESQYWHNPKDTFCTAKDLL